MITGDLITSVVVGLIGTVVAALLIRIYNEVKVLVKRTPFKHTHFGYKRDRDMFNELGVEILNGSIQNDTVYVVLRSGTFISEFAKAIAKFRSHPNTNLIVVVPNKEVFLSNYGSAIQTWITELYVNPDCGGVRALLLEPGKTMPSEARMAGYLFISDGHNHEDDEGFYTSSIHSTRFLQGYLRSLVRSGKQVEIPSTEGL